MDLTDESWKVAVAAARDWARAHGQPQPDDRMLDTFGRAYHAARLHRLIGYRTPDGSLWHPADIEIVYVGDPEP